MSDCIFCKIAAGEFNTQYVYEDEYVCAFDDLYPQAPVHTLIIPKSHYCSIQDNVPDEIMLQIFKAVQEVAKIKQVDQSGYRVISNCGADAGQTVHHFHVHVLGGMKMQEGMVEQE